MDLSKIVLRIFPIVIILANVTQSEFNKTPLEKDVSLKWLSVDSTTLEVDNVTQAYNVTRTTTVTAYASSDSDWESNIFTTPVLSSEKGFKQVKDKNYVDLTLVPTCFVLGCVGNGLTVITMSSLPFRRMTWSIVLICLAIADTTMLFVIAVRKPFVNDIFGLDILAITTLGCKTFHFIRRSSKMVSSWLVVIICIERFIAICFPLKVKNICTKAKIVVAIIAICFVAMIFSGISIQTVAIQGPICKPNTATADSPVQGQVTLIIGSLFSAVAPMSILIILTPIVCISLIRQMRARTQMTSTADLIDPYARVSAMLVSIHTSYIVLVLPHFIYTNFKFIRQLNPDLYDKKAMSVVKEVSGVLELINHSINFLLYVGFNSMFRKRLKEIFSRSTESTG